MKLRCSLNNDRAALYGADMKGRICVACIDSDGIKCEVGAKFITVFRERQNREQELKNKLIATTLLMQEEIKRLKTPI